MASAAAPMPGFLPFLPQDNVNPESAVVLELLNGDLGDLLRLPAAQFWETVLRDASLHECMDSFFSCARYGHPNMCMCIVWTKGFGSLLRELRMRCLCTR